MSEAGIWERCNACGPYPSNMVRVGVDCDGMKIYVGRAFHNGDMLPAKVIPRNKVAYVSYNGKEIAKKDFEVLRNGSFEWINGSKGAVPRTAIRIGQTSRGEPLYMGRANYKYSQTPGKVQQSHGCCYLPFNGTEVSVTDYEVLCVRCCCEN